MSEVCEVSPPILTLIDQDLRENNEALGKILMFFHGMYVVLRGDSTDSEFARGLMNKVTCCIDRNKVILENIKEYLDTPTASKWEVGR